MSNKEITTEALNLPLVDRLIIVNKLVESFNPMGLEVEKQWIDEVSNQKKLVEAGELETISYKEFFDED